MLVTVAVAALLAQPFASYEGRWRCEGRFVSSGKTIASTLDMAVDPASGVFFVRHDDAAPMPYHSVELWTVDPDGQAVHAAIADRYAGLRVFRSPPPRDKTLLFSRQEANGAQEQFRYELKPSGELQVDWSTARADVPLHLGDTLTCRRNRTG